MKKYDNAAVRRNSPQSDQTEEGFLLTSGNLQKIRCYSGPFCGPKNSTRNKILSLWTLLAPKAQGRPQGRETVIDNHNRTSSLGRIGIGRFLRQLYSGGTSKGIRVVIRGNSVKFAMAR